MKSGKIIALGLLALLPIAMKAQEAQEIEKLNARIDSLCTLLGRGYSF